MGHTKRAHAEASMSETPIQTMDDEQAKPPPINKTRLVFLLLLFLGVMLFGTIYNPGAGRSREQANRVKCQSNLRQIGVALRMDANSHEGALPNSLDEVLANEDIDARSFVCPSIKTPPAEGPTTQAVLTSFAQG